jgi:cell division protein FtsB
MTKRTVRRAVWPLVTGVVIVGLLFLLVFPTRTWLDQRRQHTAVAERVAVLREQNARLEKRASELHTDSEIERLAREQYNLVRPGEEASALLPAGPAPKAPTSTTTTTTTIRR